MSQSVDRLKELLFDSEAQALRDLSSRVDSVADIDARGREELHRLLEQVYERAGTTERLTISVSEILDDALCRAEVAQHADLSRAIAPLVVTTIKSELRNSQDEMVEALYPITGRLVKAYVASAMKDLTDQMNRRLEQNPIMLRLQSLVTGRSVAELALAGTQDFEIHELYLIRRGSGELVAHWPDAAVSGREQTMSGVLAAINEFANEAFAADQSSLRHIDLGSAEVYLRGSPLYLLAARCSGAAPERVEQVIDDTFLATVEKQHAIDSGNVAGRDLSALNAAALAEAGQGLQARIAEQKAELQRPVGRASGVKILATLILVPLLSWLAWGWYVAYEEGRVREHAGRIIAAVPGMQGYPADLDIGPRGKSLIISGLAPSQDIETQIVTRLAAGIPGTRVQDRLTVVAGSGIKIPDPAPELNKVRRAITDLEGRVVRARLIQTTDQAAMRIRQAAIDLKHAALTAANAEQTDVLQRSAAAANALLADVDARRAGLDGYDEQKPHDDMPAAYAGLAGRLESVSGEIVRSFGIDPGSNSPRQDQAASHFEPGSIDAASDRLASEAERLAALAAAVSVTNALRPPPPEPVVIAPPPAPVVKLPEPTARDRLEAFVRAKAIFFSNTTDYRDNAVAAGIAATLADLVKGAGLYVRVVGYTDESGGTIRNAPLALQRAEKVRDDLLALGVPPSLLTAVGRSDALDVSVAKGAFSPNRRVEFEVGFDGETQP